MENLSNQWRLKALHIRNRHKLTRERQYLKMWRANRTLRVVWEKSSSTKTDQSLTWYSPRWPLCAAGGDVDPADGLPCLLASHRTGQGRAGKQQQKSSCWCSLRILTHTCNSLQLSADRKNLKTRPLHSVPVKRENSVNHSFAVMPLR